MNMNLTNTTLVIAGLLLIYCAIKDVDPRDVVKNALQGKATGGDYSKGVGKVPAPTPTVPNDGAHRRASGRATTTA